MEFQFEVEKMFKLDRQGVTVIDGNKDRFYGRQTAYHSQLTQVID